MNRFDFFFIFLSSTWLIACFLALFDCSKQVKRTNRILVLLGVTNTGQKKDETEKTKAETEKKTTDSKNSFFINN